MDRAKSGRDRRQSKGHAWGFLGSLNIWDSGLFVMRSFEGCEARKRHPSLCPGCVAMGNREGSRETGQEATVIAQITATQARGGEEKWMDLRPLLEAGQ